MTSATTSEIVSAYLAQLIRISGEENRQAALLHARNEKARWKALAACEHDQELKSAYRRKANCWNIAATLF